MDALRELRKAGNVRPLPSALVFARPDGEPFEDHQWVDAWQRLCIRAGLVGKAHATWHDLRHTCASALAQNGATLPELMHKLGHKSAQTAVRYAHHIPGAAPTGSDALAAKRAR